MNNTHAVAFALAASACAPSAADVIENSTPAVIDGDAARVSRYALNASPPVLYVFNATVSLPKENASCPRMTRVGERTLLEGGCAIEGQNVLGTVELFGPDPKAPTRIVYHDWGYWSESPCQDGGHVALRQIKRGEVAITRPPDLLDTDFSISLVTTRDTLDEQACRAKRTTLASDYRGSSVRDGTATIFSGEGDVLLEDGKLHVRTEAARLDGNQCEGEPLSGTTTLSNGTDTAVITYDGATACEPKDDRALGQWALNGEPRGAIDVDFCSAAQPGFLWWVLGAVLATRRRRRVAG